jgi:hypothetical protein
MAPNTLDDPIDVELLQSRFDGSHLVRIDPQSRLIAVWNGSQTINVYDFNLSEIQEGPHTVPADSDGKPASRDEINEHIDDIFDDYR